ncbi:unnamed protein product [Lactuca saligna]|uniref:Interactor of constitutive active ROPs 3 n=1 Tax=Lactuca saligna TaxID=75948 RepID=A0AA35V3V8_LACSI|nr:unnamed protein product [Lactuca saligna]
MQTPKTSVKSSSGSEGGRKISPRSVSLETRQKSTGRVVRQLKTSGLEANSSTSIRTPKTTSTKTLDRISPKGLEPEKKRQGRVAELETQISQLEDALRTVKDQLIVSESWKKQAKLDAEESRKELLAITLKLEESQKLLALSSFHETHSNYLSAYEEIRVLKENMAQQVSIMEEMKNQLDDSRSSESKAHTLASETLRQLETAKKTMESLKTNSDDYNAIVSELQQSRERVSSLESIIEEMNVKEKQSESKEITDLKAELENLKSRQAWEISGELRKSKEDVDELRASLMDKETELQCILEENENLNAKLKNLRENEVGNESKQEFESLKLKLTSLETELSEKCDENEMLKLEIKKMKSSTEAMKKNKDEVVNVTERLEAVKMSNCEMEEELRRLKVQMSQWRKAAEAATDMLCDKSSDNNGRMLEERTWSMGHFSPRKRLNMCSPGSVEIDDDDDDEFMKRKDGNMLRRIGVLWKRPQNK